VIESLPFPDGMFDVVLSSLMFHHLPGDRKLLGLAEIYRVLKPGAACSSSIQTRPASFSQRISMALRFHQGLRSGIQDLLPVMEEVDYIGIEAGGMQSRLRLPKVNTPTDIEQRADMLQPSLKVETPRKT
jgi:SAM-dependent methyltransferase